MKIVKSYVLNEVFVVVLWQNTASAVTRMRRTITKLHKTYEEAQAEVGSLLEGAPRGTHATIERRYS